MRIFQIFKDLVYVIFWTQPYHYLYTIIIHLEFKLIAKACTLLLWIYMYGWFCSRATTVQPLSVVHLRWGGGGMWSPNWCLHETHCENLRCTECFPLPVFLVILVTKQVVAPDFIQIKLAIGVLTDISSSSSLTTEGSSGLQVTVVVAMRIPWLLYQKDTTINSGYILYLLSHVSSTGHFLSKALPSAGLLPFFQSFMCDFHSECHQNETYGELKGKVNNFRDSG